MSSPYLAVFLDNACRALDAGDVEQAARDVTHAAELCQDAPRLDDETLVRLEQVFRELIAKTEASHAALVEESRTMTNARRAKKMYQTDGHVEAQGV